MFADAGGKLRGIETERSLSAVLAHVDATGWHADCIALTGDLIQDDSRAAYASIRRHFGRRDVPVLCVPGNHDVRDFMRDELAGEPFRYCGTVAGGCWLLVGIDSCEKGSAGGRVPEREVERVAEVAAASDAEHLLVCLHHPPVAVGSAWLDQVGLANGEDFLAGLAAVGKVRGCLFGHVHQDVDVAVGDLRILGTPSTCRQFLPGSESFALDERPPAYRRLRLHADGRIEDELVWVPLDDADSDS